MNRLKRNRHLAVAAARILQPIKGRNCVLWCVLCLRRNARLKAPGEWKDGSYLLDLADQLDLSDEGEGVRVAVANECSCCDRQTKQSKAEGSS